MTDAEIDGLSVVMPKLAERSARSLSDSGPIAPPLGDVESETSGAGVSRGVVMEESDPIVSGEASHPVKEEGLPDDDRGTGAA